MPEQGEIEPFIKSVYRRDTLEELANAPMAALETRVAELLAGDVDAKKDGKDGSAEGAITLGNGRPVLDLYRIKDDKAQSEKGKDATDGSPWSEAKERCGELRQATIWGSPETLDLDKIRMAEELRATRRGMKIARGRPII